MKYRRGGYVALSLCCLISILVAVVSIEYLNQYQQHNLRTMEQDHAKEEISLVRSRLESLIVLDIYVVNSLPALIVINPTAELEDWNKVVEKIIQRGHHLRTISLAPNDVIQYVFPLLGNENVLGLDYRSIPEQWLSIQKARSLRETLISGPVMLTQGGQGLIVRVPIFTDPPFNNHYWGACSVVMDVESLFQDAGVYALSDQYNIALRGFDSAGEKGKIFFGEEKTFTNAFSQESVHFPYGNWIIAASVKADFLTNINWFQVHSVRLIGYSLLLLMLLSFMAIYRMYHVANKRSLHDALTGLPNRRYFMFTCQHQFSIAKSSVLAEGFALLNIDLDKFKMVNDQFGHDAGDKVLTSVARRIQGVLRASDIVARVGGDEFLVLLPRVMSLHDVEVIVGAIERVIGTMPVMYEHQAIEVKASVGFALYDKKFKTIEEILKVADDRMYDEKKQREQ